jgi:hypothetical protein
MGLQDDTDIVTPAAKPEAVVEQTPQLSETLKMEVAKIVNVDDIKENSIIFLRMTTEEVDVNLALALREIANRYGETLRAKNCTMLLIGKGNEIFTLDEEQMNKFGWFRKGLIIT